LQNLATPSTDAHSKPFPQFPAQIVRQEFLDWVLARGTPDTWRFHDPSPPPKDIPFEIVLKFGIPDKLRATVGKASCPICSPISPKYFEGVLAWFPEEGVLRAIGHECAKDHFGNKAVAEAAAKGKQRAAKERAENFLIETLPLIAGLRTDANSLLNVCRDIDHLKQALWRHLTKGACERVGRLGSEGVLSIDVEQKVSSVDKYGKATSRYGAAQLASFEVGGMRFLRRKLSLEAEATATLQILAEAPAFETEGAALDFVIGRLAKDSELFAAESLVRGALETVAKLRVAVQDAVDFTAPTNLATLSKWTLHERSETPFYLTCGPGNARFSAWRPKHRERSFPIPSTIVRRWTS
jgi:hypothetical protein